MKTDAQLIDAIEHLSHSLFDTTVSSPYVGDKRFPSVIVGAGVDFLSKSAAAAITSADMTVGDMEEFISMITSAVTNGIRREAATLAAVSEEELDRFNTQAEEIISHAQATKH